MEAHFSPGISPFIVRELAKAKTQIRVQAYNFTLPVIYEALVAAKARGVDVAVICDRSYRSTAPAAVAALQAAGVSVLIDASHAIAHNKLILIDGKVTITGSYNFTAAAEKSNAENIIILRSATNAASYLANWEAHAKHSTPPAAKKPR